MESIGKDGVEVVFLGGRGVRGLFGVFGGIFFRGFWFEIGTKESIQNSVIWPASNNTPDMAFSDFGKNGKWKIGGKRN